MSSYAKKIVVIPGIINLWVAEEIDFISYFHFGEIMRTFDNDKSYNTNEININLNIITTKAFMLRQNQCHIFSQNYCGRTGFVAYNKKFSFLRLGVSLEKIGKKSYLFSVTPHYLHFIKYKLENIYPIGIQIFDLLQLEIIRNGDLALYGSSFENCRTKSGALIISPPGIGKTYTLLKLVQENNFRLLGEEISYLNKIDSSYVYNYVPNTFLNSKKNSNSTSKAFNFLFARELQKMSETTAGLPKNQKHSTKAERIYLLTLDKGVNSSVERVVFNREIYKKIITIQRFPFTYYNNQLLRAYSYFNDIDIEGLYKKEEQLLSEFCMQVDIFIVRASSVKEFPELIKKNEDN